MYSSGKFSDLLVFATILLVSSRFVAAASLAAVPGEAPSAPVAAAPGEAPNAPVAGVEAVSSLNSDSLSTVGDGTGVKESAVLKRDGAIVKESGVLKRDGAVLKESGARKRDGVSLPESGAIKRDGVDANVASDRIETRDNASSSSSSSADKTLVDASSSSTTSMTTPTVAEATTTTSGSNGTIPEGLGEDMLQNRGMIVRMTYVLCGFSLLILVYFLVKAVQLRRAKSRTRKYGVLTENLDSPLGLDDDSDEEVEVFEVNGSNVRGGRGLNGGNSAADRLLP